MFIVLASGHMSDNVHHVHLVKELSTQLEPIFKNSPQAIYLYLDDAHKICNQKFADLLGYKSIQEWVDNQAPVSDISPKDQDKVIKAYMEASRKFKASSQSVSVTKKDGKTLRVDVIMVPLTYRGEVFVLHFISKNK